MKKLFVTPLLWIIFKVSIACSCQPTGFTFCESFQNDTFSNFVVLCKKIDTLAYGFKVEKLYTLYGQETRDTFWVWGDNGALCRLYDNWNIGDSLILSLHPCDTAGNIFSNPSYPPNLEKLNDYQISGCGAYALEVSNGIVSGYINEQFVQRKSVNDFITNNCLQRINTSIDKEESSFQLYPMPVANQLKIVADYIGSYDVIVYDLTGKKLSSYTSQIAESYIATTEFDLGTYIIAISNAIGVYRNKFFVAR